MQSLARRRRKNHGFEPHIGKSFGLNGFEPHIGNREHTTFGPSVFAVCLLAPYRGLQRSWGPFRAPSGKAALDASCPARHGRVSDRLWSVSRRVFLVPSLPGSFCSRRFYLLRLRGSLRTRAGPGLEMCPPRPSCPSGVSRSSARSLPARSPRPDHAGKEPSSPHALDFVHVELFTTAELARRLYITRQTDRQSIGIDADTSVYSIQTQKKESGHTNYGDTEVRLAQ